MWAQPIRHCFVQKIALLSVTSVGDIDTIGGTTNGAYCEGLCFCRRGCDAGCAEIWVGACTEIGIIIDYNHRPPAANEYELRGDHVVLLCRAILQYYAALHDDLSSFFHTLHVSAPAIQSAAGRWDKISAGYTQ